MSGKAIREDLDCKGQPRKCILSKTVPHPKDLGKSKLRDIAQNSQIWWYWDENTPLLGVGRGRLEECFAIYPSPHGRLSVQQFFADAC
jgi:hypothetical protein